MPVNRRPVEEAWEGFDKSVMPDGASELQRTEMKRSFYAGAHTLFSILMDESDDGDDEPTEENLHMMRDVQADIQQFVKDLRESEAH